MRRWRVLHNLKSHDVSIVRNATVQAITAKDVVYLDEEQNQRSVTASSVILASGAEPNDSVATNFSADFSVHNIGDSASVNYIEGALKTATSLALTL